MRPQLGLKPWVALHVLTLGATPLAAETTHPVRHVKKAALALLLSVVTDVDPGGKLLRYCVRGGLNRQRPQSMLVHSGAGRPARIQLDQPQRPRQAAGVGGQDSLTDAMHALGPSLLTTNCKARIAA